MRILLGLAYEGTRYAGWQLQGPQQSKPTIQGILENALHTFTSIPIRLHCAGRTDAGVHALAQRAHFDSPSMPAGWDWRKRLNAVLPADIRVTSCQPVEDSFHARKNALDKTYIYQFWQDSFIPPHLRNWVWGCGPLNLQAMQAALPYLTGAHDFTSFQNSGTPVKSATRIIHKLTIEPVDDYLPIQPALPLLRMSITGNGFLKQMVRNIAGYLQAIGSGKKKLQSPVQILSALSREALPTPTAPARGLFLADISYGKQ